MTALVLERAKGGGALGPTALVFLLRRYRATGRQDVCGVLGDTLAVALARHVDDRTTVERADWLMAFTEALALSDDTRLADAARDLIAALAGEWPSTTRVGPAAVSVDACLRACHIVDPYELVPRAIDELERIVAAAYRPAQGIAASTDPHARVSGTLSDHVRTASALLAAYEATGRLPYSMLAEELMQASRDHLSSDADFETVCEAARVLCRLALLHDDDAYRGAAVVAVDADYRADAEHLLTRLSGRLVDASADPARYGLALDDLINFAGHGA